MSSRHIRGNLVFKNYLEKTTAGNIAAADLANISLILVNKTSGQATAVALPAPGYVGQAWIIVDAKGDAGTNNITITPASGNINGSATYVINENYESVILVWDGTNYTIAGSGAGSISALESGYLDGVIAGTVTADKALVVDSAKQLNEFGVADNGLLKLGTDADIAAVNRATALTANTVLAGVLVGTPVTPAVAANSLIVGNVTADGDVLIATQTGGNSQAALFVDASANTLDLLAAGVRQARVSSAGLTLGLAGTTAGKLLVSGSTSGTITIQGAAAAGTYTLTLPPDDGNAGEQLQTDGAGVTTWAAAGSLRAVKNVLAEVSDKAERALQRLLGVGVYEFTYRPAGRTTTGDYKTVYTGVMAEELPEVMHHGGRIFSPVSAFGLLLQAVKALAAKVERLEAAAGPA